MRLNHQRVGEEIQNVELMGIPVDYMRIDLFSILMEDIKMLGGKLISKLLMMLTQSRFGIGWIAAKKDLLSLKSNFLILIVKQCGK